MTHAIYREILLDHARSPRFSVPITHPTHKISWRNPNCGDDVNLELNIKKRRIEEVCVEVHGCYLSVAGGSVLAEMLYGLSLSQLKSLSPDTILKSLGDFKPTPTRLDCLLLAHAALSHLEI
jgi:nitrogen fixation protein NifU and related proteins